jgi:hypothetical protein
MHSLRFWNPWKCKCPHCKSTLEMTSPWKAVAVGCLLYGGALGAVAKYQEAAGRWQPSDSFSALLWSVAGVVVLGCLAWPLVRLKVKGEAA